LKVAIAGSRRLPGGQAPRLLIRFLAALPDDAIVMLRRGLYTEPNRFELDVENLCHLVRLTVEWRVPDPTDETPGRAATYVRDYDMVESADLVILFLMSDDTGSSGTAHLQDAALQADRPVYVYSVTDVTVTRVGEYDPEHLYSELVPTP
jgi:hypothetical protein